MYAHQPEFNKIVVDEHVPDFCEFPGCERQWTTVSQIRIAPNIVFEVALLRST